MSNETPRLFAEFPPVDSEAWKARIVKDLKGKDYDETLLWKTMEGFKVAPYYRKEDLQIKDLAPGTAPFNRGNKVISNQWEIVQTVAQSDSKESNKAALDALMRGADSLNFSDPSTSKEALQTKLKDVLFNIVSIHLSGGNSPAEVIQWLKEEIRDREYDPATVSGSIVFDPLGKLTSSGFWWNSQQTDLEAAKLAIEATTDLPKLRTLHVDGRVFHEAGASITQELAYTLAQGSEYMYQLTSMGLDASSVIPKLQFNFSAGSSYFLEIAKFRVFRQLWAKVAGAYLPEGTHQPGIHIHGQSSKWTISVYDAYNNLLRATTQAMSMVLGGVDSLSILPYNQAYEKSNEFSERLARNLQLILKEESYLDKIIDPAAGSYYVEALTQQLGSKSWEMFQAIEAGGGYLEGLKKGWIQQEIRSSAREKESAVSEGKQTLVGVNKYKQEEDVSGKIFPDPTLAPNSNPFEVQPLSGYRLAKNYEFERSKEG